MDTISFGSLFTGIGGLDLGFERAGMVCAYQVEIDDFCQKVLAKHWPNVPRFKDVKNVGKQNLPTTDVICGGFPCQPHSYAGKRRGDADDRNLWPEYLRIVDELRPGVVVGENVFGIVTSMLDKVLSDLEGIGYTAQTFIVPACAFGAPHRRDRVWIVAKSNSLGRNRRPNDEGQGTSERRRIIDANTQSSYSESIRHIHGQHDIQSIYTGEYAQRNTSAGDTDAPDAARIRRERGGQARRRRIGLENRNQLVTDACGAGLEGSEWPHQSSPRAQ